VLERPHYDLRFADAGHLLDLLDDFQRAGDVARVTLNDEQVGAFDVDDFDGAEQTRGDAGDCALSRVARRGHLGLR
jgi:hypothetical protein